MSEGKLYQVLLVDDDLLVLDDLKTMIDWEEEGFQIAAIAHNGEEALACMKETLIDIIIVDIEMPLLNGLDFFTSALSTKYQGMCFAIDSIFTF